MSGFIIIGTMCFFLASEEDNIRPVWVGVMSFGLVFIILSVWKTMRNKVLLITLILIVGLSFVAKYLPFWLFDATGIVINMNYYILWALLVMFIGIPVMTVAFDKYEE